MAPPRQGKFSFRKDSTFSTEESTLIILKYGEGKITLMSGGRLGTSSFPETLARFLTSKLLNGSLTISCKLPLFALKFLWGKVLWPLRKLKL